MFFRGTVIGNQATGEFEAPADGSLSGTRAADGNQFNGTYQLTTPDTDNGTWQTSQK